MVKLAFWEVIPPLPKPRCGNKFPLMQSIFLSRAIFFFITQTAFIFKMCQDTAKIVGIVQTQFSPRKNLKLLKI